MKGAYNKLRKVLPVHPKDTKSRRLNRVQIIQRAIKYIECLEQALQVGLSLFSNLLYQSFNSSKIEHGFENLVSELPSRRSIPANQTSWQFFQQLPKIARNPLGIRHNTF